MDKIQNAMVLEDEAGKTVVIPFSKEHMRFINEMRMEECDDGTSSA